MVVDVKAVQGRLLEILREIGKLCDRHGLRWFVDGGTCLGAVRHGGFVPWDDDVDVGMPRPDFDKFRLLAKTELPAHLALLDFEDTKSCTKLFLKVHDTRTIFVEEGMLARPEEHTGVFVDVFAYDGSPAPDTWAARRLMAHGRLLQSANWVRRRPYSEAKSLAGKAQFWLFGALKALVPCNWASMRLERYLRRRPADSSPYWVLTFVNDWYFMPRESMLPVQMFPFEDMLVPCPADYDRFLRGYYGDWRQLPPPEVRGRQHTVAYYDLDRPCREGVPAHILAEHGIGEK